MIGIKCNKAIEEQAEQQERTEDRAVDCKEQNKSKDECIVELLSSPKQLGLMKKGVTKHFFSSGAFNLIQLILYVLKQTGPAHLFLTSYSISIDSLNTLLREKETGQLLSVRFLIDNRVRSISPKPFDFLVTAFPNAYRCCAMHAKVALIWNNEWQVSIVGSQNATHNPKLERGIIHTDRQVFEFDKSRLEYEFEQGTT